MQFILIIRIIFCDPSIYPNGQILRPTTVELDNIFVDLVKQLYRADTPTNIFPSLHVYNSIGACIAIMHSQRLKEYRWIQYASLVLGGLIILSTMFLKQHSVIDVVGNLLSARICGCIQKTAGHIQTNNLGPADCWSYSYSSYFSCPSLISTKSV